MAVRLICSYCQGKGQTIHYLMFKRTCMSCQGTGKFVEKKFRLIKTKKTLNKKPDFIKRSFKSFIG